MSPKPLSRLDEQLDRLIYTYESLSPETVTRLTAFYAADARFKDPFNDVRGHAAIERIFRHMFRQLDKPRFIVTGRYQANESGSRAAETMLRWEMRFESRSLGPGEHVIVGSTLLCFDDAGLITLHRDYWDAAEELFSRLPIIGALTRALRRRLAAD